MTYEEYITFVYDRIAALRMKRGMSERELSRSIGHNPSYLGSMAHDHRELSMKAILEICDLFNISLLDFLNKDFNGDVSPDYVSIKIRELYDDSDLRYLATVCESMTREQAHALLNLVIDASKRLSALDKEKNK